MLTLTDSAVKHLQELLREKGEPGKALRISVERGGCAGMSYEMALDEPHEVDFSEGRDGVKVVVDPVPVATRCHVPDPSAVTSCSPLRNASPVPRVELADTSAVTSLKATLV